jgi:hypothetical protein
MATLQLIFLIAAMLCFGFAAFNVPARWNLIAAGLCLWVATLIPGLVR